jgi:hypothetical protein
MTWVTAVVVWVPDHGRAEGRGTFAVACGSVVQYVGEQCVRRREP